MVTLHECEAEKLIITKFVYMQTNFNKINFTLPLLQIQWSFLNYYILIKNQVANSVFKILKHHFKWQFKILMCITGLDTFNNKNRFTIIYELLSLKFNNRLKLKLVGNELTPICSIKNIFITANWWENEIWDMFGIVFLKRYNLTRLLTDYGFSGFPLRKDFPLSGFLELKYNLGKSKILYNKLELGQSYRTFNYKSPWHC